MQKPAGRTAVVVGPVFVNGTAVVREMAAKGAWVVAVDSDPDAPGLHSRHAREKVLLPSPGDEPGAFTEFLLRRRDLYGALVMPTDDFHLRALYEDRRALEDHYRLSISAGDAVRIALHKDLASAAATRAGVAAPKERPLGPGVDLKQAAADVGFPAIVKPVFSITFNRDFKTKAFRVKNLAELEEAFRAASAGDHRVVLQEVIPGGDAMVYIHCSYWNSSGECAGDFVYEKTLQYPPIFGVGQFVRVVKQPDVIAAGRRLLGYMGYAGAPAAVEFKLDRRTDVLKLIDINTRTPMQTALLRPAGCDILEMLWRDKFGLAPLPPGRIRYGRTWVYLKNGILRHRGHPEHRPGAVAYLSQLASRPVFALLSLDDPKPFTVDMMPLIKRRVQTAGSLGIRQEPAGRHGR